MKTKSFLYEIIEGNFQCGQFIEILNTKRGD